MAPIRIGMITPSSNTVLEPLTSRVTWALDRELSVHYTRLVVTRITLEEESLDQFSLEAMIQAARLLADARVSVICWNGTSGAWNGLDADVRICRTIEQQTGIPATTGTIGQIDALRRFGLRRYGLAVPYVDEVREAIVRVYGKEGFECARSAGLGISVNYGFAEVPEFEIRELIRRADSPEAECIVVVCTNLAAGRLVEAMERELGKPIFDSTLVSLWHPLVMAGYARPIPGWGELLRSVGRH